MIKAWQKKLSRMGVAVRPAKIFMLHDVTPCDNEFDLLSLQVITAAPVSMSQAERLLLYALNFSLRPNNYLEIGTLYGGSALIVAAAMKSAHDNGRIFCIDPAPQICSEYWQQLAARTTLIKGLSPDVLPQARAIAGAPFDFALVDGDHGYYQCLQDAEALLPLVIDGATCFSMTVSICG